MAKDKFLPYKVLSIAAFVLAVFIFVQLLVLEDTSSSIPTSMPDIADLSIIGFVEVTPAAAISGGIGVVSLTGGCYQVVANTDASQALSIINGMEDKIGVRPNTHDVMKEVFETLDIEVVMVKVVDLVDNNYIGRLIVKQSENILSLDSRPSDGIAMAVRTDAKIYFKENLLKEMGDYIC